MADPPPPRPPTPPPPKPASPTRPGPAATPKPPGRRPTPPTQASAPKPVPREVEAKQPEAPKEPYETTAGTIRPNKGIQALIESTCIVLFLGLTAVPLARLGIVPLDSATQINVLVAASLLLPLMALLFRKAGYRAKGPLGARVASRRKDDAILNALSVALILFVFVVFLVELGAILVFANVLQSSGSLVVTAAQHFVLFSTFALLFLDLLLITRTSFDSRHRSKAWHKPTAHALLGTSYVFVLLALLKNLDLLNVSFFAGIRPEQSGYLVTAAVFFQLIAFRLLLRYPAISRVFINELEAAKRASKAERELLQRKALQTYLGGLVFILVSFILIGGVSTGQVAKGDTGTSNALLVLYVSFAVAVFLLILARYLQHRFLHHRQRRVERGEVVARRRLTREQIGSIFVYSFSGIFALLFLAMSVITFRGQTLFKVSLGTDFLIMAFLAGVGPFGFRHAMRVRRRRAMEEKFPDFLRDLAEGVRAGMTLPRALYTAAQGSYGALTPEIRLMSNQVEWGISFTDSLERFQQRVKTPLISRIVSLVTEASRAGGSVVDILTAAATDAQEIQQILEERRRQMGIYSVIIYVAYLVFLVVIFVLANQFLPSFQEAVKGASGQQVGGFQFAAFNVSTYVRIFWHAALIQGIGGGLVAGLMTEGHPVGGLKHSFAMVIISWVFFRGFL